MKILVTGSNGFIGRNLISQLKNIRDGKANFNIQSQNLQIYECDTSTTDSQLEDFCRQCDFVFHLAGINRPQNAEEFMIGNFGFTTKLLDKLQKFGNKSPIVMSSSIQAVLCNDYGASKKAGEDYLINYGKSNNINIYIFRLPNVFGKWCKPNYNSVIATFCNNVAQGLPITINDKNTELTLVYIDDVVDAFLNVMQNKIFFEQGYCKVETQYKIKLGYIAQLLQEFAQSRENLLCQDMTPSSFEKKLYSTYLSYLPQDKFCYDLKMNVDARGSFTEFLKTQDKGQVSINISHPNIVKGNHWHHSKNEKFLVVAGQGVIRFRKIDSDQVIEYFVSADKLQVVDIPTGYTHNIENLGNSDMVTVMWANEAFDPKNPDTFFEKV